jgi:hypothetical protein
MANQAAKFANIVRKISQDSVPTESYLGVLIHTYRRKRNLNSTQLANQWGMEEESLLRIEYGFGSPEEINFIFSKMHLEKT